MDGWTKIVAYTDGRQIVVLEQPCVMLDRKNESPDYHSCDANGCGQQHVILRASLPQSDSIS